MGLFWRILRNSADSFDSRAVSATPCNAVATRRWMAKNATGSLIAVKRIYQDSISGARDGRPGLKAFLAAMVRGASLVIWKLDWLGRSLRHLVNTIGELTARGIGLKVLTGEGSMIGRGRLIRDGDHDLFHIVLTSLILGQLAEYGAQIFLLRSRV